MSGSVDQEATTSGCTRPTLWRERVKAADDLQVVLAEVQGYPEARISKSALRLPGASEVLLALLTKPPTASEGWAEAEAVLPAIGRNGFGAV